MIKAIKFASIPTTDQDRAVRFWTEQVGFAVHTDQRFSDSQRWIESRIKGADTHLVLFTTDTNRAQLGQFQGLSFVCGSVAKTYEELAAAGVEFVSPPRTESWGTSAIFMDPDGNSFVLSSR
jgi:predicted enzyme related to lactoylglutathione lyase